MKEETIQCTKPKSVEPVLEEFIPLKKNSDCDEDRDGDAATVKKEKEISKDNKKNWMSSVQLWNTDDDLHTTHDPIFHSKQNHNLKIKVNH